MHKLATMLFSLLKVVYMRRYSIFQISVFVKKNDVIANNKK